MNLPFFLGLGACLLSVGGCTPTSIAGERPASAARATPPKSVSAPAVHAIAPRALHDYGTSCSPEVLKKAWAVDLRADEANTFFRDRFKASNAKGEKCALELVHLLSERIDASTYAPLRDGYYGTVATYARFLAKDTMAAVEAAYLRTGFDRENSRSFFLGLREARIDLRAFLKTRVGKDDWSSFSGPSASSTEDATTWYYYVYLASLETPGALEAIERKVRATQSGNDVANLLRDLAELKTSPAKPAVRRLIASFANDPRRTDGPDGPGLKLSEAIPFDLQSFDQ
jgi:hypothetical protein